MKKVLTICSLLSLAACADTTSVTLNISPQPTGDYQVDIVVRPGAGEAPLQRQMVPSSISSPKFILDPDLVGVDTQVTVTSATDMLTGSAVFQPIAGENTVINITLTPEGNATCSDRVQNGDEEGIDCGGSCPDCAGDVCDNNDCEPNATCMPCPDDNCSGFDFFCQCPQGFSGEGTNMNPCVALPQECLDGVQNGNETDVDCGGDTCAQCADGSACLDGPDCMTGICANMRCGDPCADGVMNGAETDVDCGGNMCGACGIGRACQTDQDCIGPSFCNSDNQCADELDINVPNFSFETVAGGLPVNWVNIGDSAYGVDPTRGDTFSALPDGDRFAWINTSSFGGTNPGSIRSEPFGMVRPGTYTLRVAVGHRLNGATVNKSQKVALFAGMNPIGEATLDNPKEQTNVGEFRDIVLSAHVPMGSNFEGMPIVIRLTAEQSLVPQANEAQGQFDNVRLHYRIPMNVDECMNNTNTCAANATCNDTPESFTCACDAGFVGDGTNCACPSGMVGPQCADLCDFDGSGVIRMSANTMATVNGPISNVIDSDFTEFSRITYDPVPTPSVPLQIQITLSAPTNVSSMRVTSDWFNKRPKDWHLYASNDPMRRGDVIAEGTFPTELRTFNNVDQHTWQCFNGESCNNPEVPTICCEGADRMNPQRSNISSMMIPKFDIEHFPGVRAQYFTYEVTSSYANNGPGFGNLLIREIEFGNTNCP